MADLETIAVTVTANRQLSAKDELLVSLLTAGTTPTAAATQVGCGVSTVYRRLREPGFKAALHAARAGLWQPDAERLRGEVSRSIDRLVLLRDSERSHPSTQLRAAVAIIDLATKLHDLVDTGPRIAALEAALTGVHDE